MLDMTLNFAVNSFNDAPKYRFTRKILKALL